MYQFGHNELEKSTQRIYGPHKQQSQGSCRQFTHYGTHMSGEHAAQLKRSPRTTLNLEMTSMFSTVLRINSICADGLVIKCLNFEMMVLDWPIRTFFSPTGFFEMFWGLNYKFLAILYYFLAYFIFCYLNTFLKSSYKGYVYTSAIKLMPC